MRFARLLDLRAPGARRRPAPVHVQRRWRGRDDVGERLALAIQPMRLSWYGRRTGGRDTLSCRLPGGGFFRGFLGAPGGPGGFARRSEERRGGKGVCSR